MIVGKFFLLLLLFKCIYGKIFIFFIWVKLGNLFDKKDC